MRIASAQYEAIMNRSLASNRVPATSITFMLAWYIFWYSTRLTASSSELTALAMFG